MKNSTIQSNETESPKTPGGISKSFLTPIRRLGLSRKWKKSGISPFVSPLASDSSKSVDNAREEKKSRKRRLCVDNENINLSPVVNSVEQYDASEIATTPSASKVISPTDTPIRKVSITRKKSKIMPCNAADNKDTDITISQKELIVSEHGVSDLNVPSINEDVEENQTSNIFLVTPSSPQELAVEKRDDMQSKQFSIAKKEGSKLKEISNVPDNVVEVNPIIPNKLAKKCIVVIQNKVFKLGKKTRKCDSMSQILFDSDSDDTPLSNIIRTDVLQKNNNIDVDMTESSIKNSLKVKAVKKTKSTSSRKSVTSSKQQKKDFPNNRTEHQPSSQSSNSFDDDDDDFEVNKKTILIRKSYDKVVKPIKAKSTGSITQKDIDELKARIEIKKKLLLAKTKNKDTEELRGLIKKWQKGCQDALMELLELMKNKLLDQPDMGYSNILEILQIPPALVGYDAENDCFNTPDDDSILAATFNDL